MRELSLKPISTKLAKPAALVIALISICLSACNGNELASGRLVRIDKTKVIVPEVIPEDQLTIPPCDERELITWGDARDAADYYEDCSDLRGQQMKNLVSTLRGRWRWMQEQKKAAEEENAFIEAEAAKLFKDD